MVEVPYILREQNRFKNKELQHLEKHFHKIPYQIYQNEVKNIHLSLVSNPYNEIEQVARQIVTLVREKGYRYQDIAVMTKTLDNYTNLVKAIFNQYNIPVFIDEKKELSQNLFVKYLLSILEIFAKNWSYESVFQYLKSSFVEIDQEELYRLENYCIKWGIKGKKWYDMEWQFRDEEEIGKEQSQRFRELRKQIVEPLQTLRKNTSGTKQVEQITKALYQFILEQKLDQKLEKKVQELEKEGKPELAAEYVTSWGIVLNVLDEMILVFGEDKTTFEKYIALLKTGLGNSELRKDTSSTRSSNIRRC